MSRDWKYDVPFWAFALTTKHRTYRHPSESDLRWKQFTNLAYGAKGLWYFNTAIHDYGKSVPYTSTCAYYLFADILQRTARLFGETDEAARYENEKEEIREALHRTFSDAATGVCDKGSQTAYVLALKLNLVPDKERPRIIENLREQIAKDDYHLSSGFVGLPFLLTELTEIGLGDLAWKISTP